ncbi:hypothetical protein, partial [Gemmiger sp.]|uniref:hypothetical protein n=1 Tax=Gemmiger sp. TaxID=2049027 RepID=UPI003A9143E0
DEGRLCRCRPVKGLLRQVLPSSAACCGSFSLMGEAFFDARFSLPQFLQFFKQLRLFSCEKLRAILKLPRVAYRTTPSTATKGANHYADERVFHRQPEG